MCGFLRKALVMSFTTLCTSTATSSFVSAMLAVAAIRRASGRTQPLAGVPRGRARARPGSAAFPPRPPSTSGSGRAAELLGWAGSSSTVFLNFGSLGVEEGGFLRTSPSRRVPGWPLSRDLRMAAPCPLHRPTRGGGWLLTSFCTLVLLCV